MKVLAVVGSIRRGNTYTMVEAAAQALNCCDVDLINLKDISITHCNGCL
ncbi:NAD(P)H-dependent oxidoreductase [Marichromatium sp. AB32]|nr:flavodoxin family protein [Marichromatium sp. AB32]